MLNECEMINEHRVRFMHYTYTRHKYNLYVFNIFWIYLGLFAVLELLGWLE
jgi:hypothetical protein